MSLIKIFTTSYIAQALVLLLGLANNIIITRALGVEGRGIYSLAMTLVMIMSLFFGEGLQRANTWYAGKEPGKIRQLFSNQLIYTGGIFLISLIIAGFFSDLFIVIMPGLDKQLVILAIVAAAVWIALKNISSIYLGIKDFTIYNFYQVLPFVFNLAANFILLVFFTVTPVKVLLNYNYSVILAFGFIFYIFITQKGWARPDIRIARSCFGAGFKAAVSHISLFLLFRIDIILINLFVGIKATGLYSIAVLMAELLQKLANTSGNVLFPLLSNRGKEKTKQLTNRVMLLVFISGMVFTLFMIFGGRYIIVKIFNEDFAGAVPALYWLLPGTVLMACAKVINFALWARDFHMITVIAPLSALLLNVVLNLLLIPQLEIIGAAIATSISYTLYGVILGCFYIKSNPA